MKKVDLIKKLFNELNTVYFENQLPTPQRIEFRNVKTYLGQFRSHFNSKCYRLQFSSAYEMTDFELEKVLIHEMIHVWQWFNKKQVDHGKTFKNKAREINIITNNKYEIARCTNIEKSQCIKETKTFDGFLIRYKKRSLGEKELFAVCSNKCLNSFKWIFLKNDIYDISCFAVNGDFYNDFKKSVKILHGYFITDEYLKQINNTILYEKIDF